jgi:hypothetical protein
MFKKNNLRKIGIRVGAVIVLLALVVLSSATGYRSLVGHPQPGFAPWSYGVGHQ